MIELDEQEQASHAARIGADENAPSRWRLRPAFRLTATEAATTRRAINLGRSVLGAAPTLRGRPRAVKHSCHEIVRGAREASRLRRRAFRVGAHEKRHRAGGASFVRLSDRPPPKRLPVGEPSTSDAPYSVQSAPRVEDNPVKAVVDQSAQIAKFSFRTEATAHDRTCSGRSKDERGSDGPDRKSRRLDGGSGRRRRRLCRRRTEVRRAGNAFVHLPDEPSASA